MTLYRRTAIGRVPLAQAEEDEINALAFADAKSQKTHEIQVAYEAEIYSDINYMTWDFEADEYTHNTLSQIISGGDRSGGFFWKDATGVMRNFTLAEIVGFAAAIRERGMIAFQNRETKLVAIAAATTQAELDLIVY